jgi:hypothetical protein
MFGDFVRFPEHLDQVVRKLKLAWAKDMWPLFKQFEDWACDSRFVLAGVEPLRPFNEYDWFEEGLEG